jgi:CubicO group peptidase (beta-lactamase class C family)
MLKKIALFLIAALHLQASLFDWMYPVSDRARRAQASLEGFDQIIEKALIDYQIPGLAIGIMVDGHLVYSKGFGMRDLEKKWPVTPNTLFPIGSCSKAFTAFTVGTLVDEGVISWDTRVIDLFPEFRLWDQYATQNLTMRDLLTHRSGMPRHDFMWYNSTMSRAEFMQRLRYLEPSCDIRERYQYNNLMYVAAGFAIEQVMQKTWEELVSARILLPLDMRNTNFSVEKMEMAADFSSGYIQKGNQLKKIPLRNVSVAAPAAGINSNISDLTRWVQMQLDGGVWEQRALISPATLQEVHSPQVIITGVPESKESLMYASGIGWNIASYRGHYFVSHDGGVDGFTSVVGLLPQQGIGIIVLANKNLTPCPRYVSLQAIDRILELPTIHWIQEGLDGLNKNKETQNENKLKEDALRKKGTSPSHSLEDYVGQYNHPGYGNVDIALADDRLQVTCNGITSLLDHWHYDVFMVAEETQDLLFSREGTKLSFCTGVNGDVEELLIPFELKANNIVFKRKAPQGLSSLEYMRQFVGPYEIYGYTVEIVVRNQALSAIIPGEPVYELVPVAENEFTVKSLTGYTVRFILDTVGKVAEVLLIQPYGTFTARPKHYAMNM